MARYPAYIICTSPRSGSTLLCQLLTATGISGNPGSLFHEPSLADWLEDYGLSADQYPTKHAALRAVFKAARAYGTGKTNMFGLRMQRHSFDFFMKQLDLLHPGLATDQARIGAAFGDTLFIHLTRSNKVEQAISYVKATQTGLWHRAADGTELERLSAPRAPVYDAPEITRRLTELSAQDTQWRAWFAAENLTPLRITYDDLSENPTDVLALILDRLGLDKTVARGIRPAVARLADETSHSWASRYLDDTQG